MYPHYSKKLCCPTIFVKCWWVMWVGELKWLYSSWECILFFKWLFPLIIHLDSHFCLLTHALKMKPDGLWFRRRKFLKIVIFVWWPSDHPPDHMGARTPKKCTPTIQKNSVARPFLWNVGEWWKERNEYGCTRARSAYFFSNGYSPYLFIMTRIFVSWHMLSKWNLMDCGRDDENF